MKLRCGVWAIPAACVLVLAGCATTDLRPGLAPPEGVVLEARAFPEIELLTTGGAIYVCKLTRLEKNAVGLLPSPYWNVETKPVALAEIHSIRRRGQKSPVGRGAVLGFGVVSCLTGIYALGVSKYDSDYSGAMLAVPIVGLLFGAPVGFMGGALGGLSSNPRRWDFRDLTTDRKYGVLRRLMGL